MNTLKTFALCLLCTPIGFAQTAIAPYQLSVFASAPAGLSAPDSVAVIGDRVFVGFGDGHAPDGSDGLNSQVVEYRLDGSVAYTYTVKGHNDGLKVNPRTQELWAIQNEDLNPTLVIINPETHAQKTYTFGPTPHGGGYDDVVFLDGKVFISASNPANNPNNGPAIVRAKLDGSTVDVEEVLNGAASAIDIPTDAAVTLNLQDPDSMTSDPEGNLVLDSQADQELIIVSHPATSSQRVLHLPLSYVTGSTTTPVEVDDTIFTTSTQGYILISDKKLNEIFKLSKKAFAPGAAYTAADGGPFVGTVNMTTGVITPIVTGLQGPGGMWFVDTSKPAGNPSPCDGEDCGHEDDNN